MSLGGEVNTSTHLSYSFIVTTTTTIIILLLLFIIIVEDLKAKSIN